MRATRTNLNKDNEVVVVAVANVEKTTPTVTAEALPKGAEAVGMITTEPTTPDPSETVEANLGAMEPPAKAHQETETEVVTTTTSPLVEANRAKTKTLT